MDKTLNRPLFKKRAQELHKVDPNKVPKLLIGGLMQAGNMIRAGAAPAYRYLAPKVSSFMNRPGVQTGIVGLEGYGIGVGSQDMAQGVVEGSIPAYYGMEVVHFSSLPANEILISAPQNIVMLTDDYNDVKAIDMKYEAELSSDKIWGQFKLGFSYLKGEEIVYAKDFA